MVAFRRCWWCAAVVFAFGCQTAPVASPAEQPTVAAVPVAGEYNVFAIPSSALICRRTDLPRSAPADLLGLEFEDGRSTPNARLMRGAWNAGNPVFLVVTGMENTPTGAPAAHVLSVSFPEGKPATGFRVLHPEDRNNTATEPLTAAEVARARELAVWLWGRRCRNP
jgi:hypothetical protein